MAKKRTNYERLSGEEALERSLENARENRQYAQRIGQKLLKLAWSRGWSQRRFADEFASSSRSTVNRWTIGTGVPSASELVEIHKKFGVSLDYLLLDEVDDPMGGMMSKKQREILALVEKIGHEEAEARLLGVSPAVGAPVAVEPGISTKADPARDRDRDRRTKAIRRA